MQKVAARYEKATGKKFDDIKGVIRMGFRSSGCPQCGYGLYEDQIILEQRIINSDDRGCTLLETRKCKMCDHRYSVEMQYNLAGERFVRNEHKKVPTIAEISEAEDAWEDRVSSYRWP